MKFTASVLVALCFSSALTFLPAGATHATDVTAVSLTVSNLDSAIRFYTEVLEFKLDRQGEVAGDPYETLYGVFGARIAFARMRLGTETLELLQFLVPAGRPVPADSRANDRAFQHVAIIVSDMARAYARLREHHVRYASSEPQRLPAWNPNAGGIEAFYFRDPDGHYLELLQFPLDKGAAQWHQASTRLFLGIDHTAIVVDDTAKSIAFYAALGLKVAGHSENYGTEQEHLNNVFGAHLLITALRGEHGPGVELLEYLAPRDGRPLPADTRSNDLWHWHVVMSHVWDSNPEVPAHHHKFVVLPDPGLGLSNATMVSDPDGHALILARH